MGLFKKRRKPIRLALLPYISTASLIAQRRLECDIMATLITEDGTPEIMAIHLKGPATTFDNARSVFGLSNPVVVSAPGGHEVYCCFEMIDKDSLANYLPSDDKESPDIEDFIAVQVSVCTILPDGNRNFILTLHAGDRDRINELTVPIVTMATDSLVSEDPITPIAPHIQWIVSFLATVKEGLGGIENSL